MKFKYSAFIENTPEMREWLVKLGYKGHAGDHEFIIASDGHYSGTDLYMKVLYPCVNCYSNPSLFKAVTAVREDSDYMQWFVINQDYHIYKKGDFFQITYGYKHPVQGLIVMWKDGIGETFSEIDYNNRFHKATLSELQEHFKTKQP